MKSHFGSMDTPSNVKTNALLYLHNYCNVYKSKIRSELEPLSKSELDDFEKMMEQMPEPI